MFIGQVLNIKSASTPVLYQLAEAINSKLKQFNSKLVVNYAIHKFEFSWLRCQINEGNVASAAYIMKKYNACSNTRFI